MEFAPDNKIQKTADYHVIQTEKKNKKQHRYEKQAFLKISIPIQEIDTEDANFFFLTAKGRLNNVDMGLKLFISKSFQPIFGLKNGDIEQVRDPIEAQVKNGLVIWGGEDILSDLINRMAHEWELPSCPVVNDLNCDGQLLWGDISTLKPYKVSKIKSVKIEPADFSNFLTKDTPLNLLHFKVLGFYEIRFPGKPLDESEVGQVPFFININLDTMTVDVEEKDLDLRREFINLFCLDESYRENRLNNKDKVMLILKAVECHS
ncbi:MAG: hypothetical protein K2X02_08745 [Alphaproteobacteria bacterium]|nr:hypothetical protein [Alphaproteobacteria bacterium]